MRGWGAVAAAALTFGLLARRRCDGWRPRTVSPARVVRREVGAGGVTLWCEFRGPFPGRVGALFIPEGARASGGCVNLAVHAHGHRARVDTKIVQHALREQVAEARADWVLVMPQSAWMEADSDPGTFDEAAGPAEFIAEVLATLEAHTRLGATLSVGYLLLSSHSGGFWTVASFLENAGDQVDDVVLFDSLYAAEDEYVEWMESQYRNQRPVRWLNIHLGGDPLDSSDDVAADLRELRVPIRELDAGEAHRTLAQWPRADTDEGELYLDDDVDVALPAAYPPDVAFPGYINVDARDNPQRHTWLPLGNYRWVLDTSGAR